MNAIILTESQVTAFAAAREPKAIRILEPRRLDDGRLILNADVLDDPLFSDPTQPWAQILAGAEMPADSKPNPESAELSTAIVTALADARASLVDLTERDLGVAIEELPQSEILKS